MKKHNFYAGPSILSEYTIKNNGRCSREFCGYGFISSEISTEVKNSLP